MTKATHDLLVLNNTSNESKTYMAAFDVAMKERDEDGPSDLYDYEYGFETGYWAAVRELTGFKAEYDRD